MAAVILGDAILISQPSALLLALGVAVAALDGLVAGPQNRVCNRNLPLVVIWGDHGGPEYGFHQDSLSLRLVFSNSCGVLVNLRLLGSGVSSGQSHRKV